MNGAHVFFEKAKKKKHVEGLGSLTKLLTEGFYYIFPSVYSNDITAPCLKQTAHGPTHTGCYHVYEASQKHAKDLAKAGHWGRIRSQSCEGNKVSFSDVVDMSTLPISTQEAGKIKNSTIEFDYTLEFLPNGRNEYTITGKIVNDQKKVKCRSLTSYFF